MLSEALAEEGTALILPSTRICEIIFSTWEAECKKMLPFNQLKKRERIITYQTYKVPWAAAT